MNNEFFFERSSKRRKGFPSETGSNTAFRVVHSEKELFEKLGGKTPVLADQGRRFQELLYAHRPLRGSFATTTGDNNKGHG